MFSWPSQFSTGTFYLCHRINSDQKNQGILPIQMGAWAVPAKEEYNVLIRFVSTPSVRSIRSIDRPPSVRTAVEKKVICKMTLSSLACSSLGSLTARDPLFGPVHNLVFPIWRFHRHSLDACHIRTCLRLCEDHALLTAQDLRYHLGLQSRGTKVQHGRNR